MGKDLTVGKISFGPLLKTFNDTFKQLDDMFNKAFQETFKELTSNIKVKEDKDKVYVTADVPGFDKKDLNITVKNGYVFIEGLKTIKQKKDTTKRSVSLVSKLPSNVTLKNADAEYKDGILNVVLNKKECSCCSKITIK